MRATRDRPRPRPAGYVQEGRVASLWGKEHLDDDVYTAALERTREAFDRHDHVLVAFSGGKDSTAVLEVALTVAAERDRLPLRVVHFDEECISYETEAYVRRTAQRPDVALEWYCLPVEHRNACSTESPTWWPWAPEARDLWARPLPPEALTELEGFPIDPPAERLSVPETADWLIARPDRDGLTAVLMGIRAAESITRRRAIANSRPDNWVIPVRPGVNKAYPVYDWSAADVWEAPAVLGWDHNESYDRMAMHGFTAYQQRVAPPFGEQPMRDLSMWAACFPELWDRMCARVPGAATAARYSTTELYAHGTEHIAPAEGQTWRQLVLELLDGYEDPAVRAFVAAKVRATVKRHYRKTPDPIMPTGRHPETGISWEWLATMAHRGDLKDRMQLMETPRVAARAEFAERYAAERAAYDRGEFEL